MVEIMIKEKPTSLKFSSLTHFPKKSSLRKRRGISEVIVTLLLLAVTVSGSALISVFFIGDNFTTTTGASGGIGAALDEEVASIYPVQITGYDTRDSADLSGITALDNVSNSLLCSKSCVGSTDFIVLDIGNKNPESFFMSSILVNGTEHVFDDSAAGDLLGTSFPDEGKFSIIPPINDVTLTQSSDKEINAGADVRLVIRLSEDMDKDIKLNKAIRIVIHSSLLHDAKTIVISSGSIK